MFACPAANDIFLSRIDQMIDLRHPLAVLSSYLPWQKIEASDSHLFVRKAHDQIHLIQKLALARSLGPAFKSSGVHAYLFYGFNQARHVPVCGYCRPSLI
jgi:hypothetical protein